MCLTGGTEIMSSLPLLVRNIRFGATLGARYTIEDHIKTQFLDTYTGITLQKIAENVAKRRGNEFFIECFNVCLWVNKLLESVVLPTFLTCLAFYKNNRLFE